MLCFTKCQILWYVVSLISFRFILTTLVTPVILLRGMSFNVIVQGPIAFGSDESVWTINEIDGQNEYRKLRRRYSAGAVHSVEIET